MYYIPRMIGIGEGQFMPLHARENWEMTKERLGTSWVDTFLKYNARSVDEHGGDSITPARTL